MATRNKKPTVSSDGSAELLRDLIIIQLGLAGVGQKEIRDIVGGDIVRVNRIVKLLRKKSNKSRKTKE